MLFRRLQFLFCRNAQAIADVPNKAQFPKLCSHWLNEYNEPVIVIMHAYMPLGTPMVIYLTAAKQAQVISIDGWRRTMRAA